MAENDNHDYLIALYVIVAGVLASLVLLFVYVCCSKQFKLNWYERSLLEENRRQQSEQTTDNTQHKQTTFASDQYESDCSGYKVTRNRKSYYAQFKPLKAIVEVIKSLKKLSTRLKSSSDQDFGENGNKTEWIVCSGKTMGSSPSSPMETSDLERFWVPPAVVDRKRAQSLVPVTQHVDSEEDSSSGTVTPASLGGTKEFTYNFQTTPVISTDILSSMPGQGHQRQRRASMQDAIDLRQIDSKLYDRRLQRQESVASVEEETLGNLNFSLDFNQETNLLTIYLIEAENLVSRDFSGTADPYCKVCLHPNNRNPLQSKVHRKTTNPVFDEEFIFEVDPDDLGTQTLEVLVYDFDQFSRDECIGQVKVLFDNLDFNHRQTMWKPVCPKELKRNNDYGDLIFSLGYLSSAERLTVVVMKARSLRHSEDGKITMDPYVKVSLNYGCNKKAKKKKTSTKHNVFTPVWNEALTFNLPKDSLTQAILDLTVYHDNKMGNDEVLGRARISRDSNGDERIHWDEMVNCRSAVARWHSLTM